MPPRQKFSKAGTKAKAVKEPQSENDFLELADEHEQAAGKWKAGDAAKALRFFNRAIDAYNAGLARYPNSFDLAYNKANLQYNMSEEPRIAKLLGPRLALLEETLQSHRNALNLNPLNPDVLFNTGQVLTSCAEALLDGQGPVNGADRKTTAKSVLEEAVQMFTQCFDRQRSEYREMQAVIKQAKQAEQEKNSSNPQEKIQTPEAMDTSSATSGPVEWATIEDPVTPTTIVETLTAQINALTMLLPLYEPSTEKEKAESAAHLGFRIADDEIELYVTMSEVAEIRNSSSVPGPPAGPTLSLFSGSSTHTDNLKLSPEGEACLASAEFHATVSELSYRSGMIETAQYLSNLEKKYAPMVAHDSRLVLDDKSNRPAVISAMTNYAEALLDFSSAVSDNPNYLLSEDSKTLIQFQNTALSRAQSLLRALITPSPSASTPYAPLPDARLARIYLLRGDIALAHAHISLHQDPSSTAISSNTKILLKNAGVFYRGARTYASAALKNPSAASFEMEELHRSADARALIAEERAERFGAAEAVREAGGQQQGRGELALREKAQGRAQEVRREVERMVEEGVLPSRHAEGVARSLGVWDGVGDMVA